MKKVVETVRRGDAYYPVCVKQEVHDVPTTVVQPDASPMDDFLDGVEHGVSLAKRVKKIFNKLKRL